MHTPVDKQHRCDECDQLDQQVDAMLSNPLFPNLEPNLKRMSPLVAGLLVWLIPVVVYVGVADAVRNEIMIAVHSLVSTLTATWCVAQCAPSSRAEGYVIGLLWVVECAFLENLALFANLWGRSPMDFTGEIHLAKALAIAGLTYLQIASVCLLAGDIAAKTKEAFEQELKKRP